MSRYWRELVVNYVADQNQCAPNDITTTRGTCNVVQSSGISRPLLNRRGCITISAFTGGLWYKRVYYAAKYVWLTRDRRGRVGADFHIVNRSTQLNFKRYFESKFLTYWICPPITIHTLSLPTSETSTYCITLLVVEALGHWTHYTVGTFWKAPISRNIKTNLWSCINQT